MFLDEGDVFEEPGWGSLFGAVDEIGVIRIGPALLVNGMVTCNECFLNSCVAKTDPVATCAKEIKCAT